MAKVQFTDDLETWDAVERNFPEKNRGLLIGNGASMALWGGFGYESLYKMACDETRRVHLQECDKKVFDHLNTKNFESVLSALIIAGKVWCFFDKPRIDVEDLRQSYGRIRASLIQAVHDVHIPYAAIDASLKANLREIFAQYDYVYSTNYDLLLYWSMMDEPKRFKDFFWTKDPDETASWFDIADTSLWNQKCTKILFLHGALHLYRDQNGSTFKKLAGEQGALLSQFYVRGDAIPLFISEGTWKDKLSAINRNHYLSFAYERFAKHRGSLVIFGNSLSEEYDKHIIDAINKWRRYDQMRMAGGSIRRVIALSVYPGDGTAHDIVAFKTRIAKALPNYELKFFDSTTHPLGKPELQVTVS